MKSIKIYKYTKSKRYMAINESLEEVVLRALANHLIQIDPAFNLMVDGEQELAIESIKHLNLARTDIDEPAKLRMVWPKGVAYGYDFEKKHDDVPAKQIYEKAVTNTKKYGGGPHMEILVNEGIEGERFGWYLTEFNPTS